MEVSIAAGLSSVLVIAIMLMFVHVLRQERTNVRLLRMAYDSAALHRTLRGTAANRGKIINANAVRFTALDGTVSELRYEDEDDDPNTIGDNRIVFEPDVSGGQAGRVIVNHVSPLLDTNGVAIPIFRRIVGNTSPQPLEVSFRIGDRTQPDDRASDDDAVADDAFTGPGFQSLVIRSVFTPRNS